MNLDIHGREAAPIHYSSLPFGCIITNFLLVLYQRFLPPMCQVFFEARFFLLLQIRYLPDLFIMDDTITPFFQVHRHDHEPFIRISPHDPHHRIISSSSSPKNILIFTDQSPSRSSEFHMELWRVFHFYATSSNYSGYIASNTLSHSPTNAPFFPNPEGNRSHCFPLLLRYCP